MGLFENILDKVIKNPIKEPLSYYGLKSFEIKSTTELEESFVNFEAEITQLLNQILSISPDKPTTRIAIIGPSGSGKSTLLQYLSFKIKTLRMEPQYEKELEKIKFLPPLFFKGLPKSLLKMELDIFKRNEGAAIIIDDFHEIFIDENPQLIESYFKILTSETKNNILITTWLPYGWAYALSKYPELKNIFDTAIFIKGLTREHCRELVEKRFRYCSKNNDGLGISEEPSFKPFTKSAIEKIIDLGCPNPNIILSFLQKAVSFAFDKNLSEITENEIEDIKSKLGYDLKIDGLTPTQKELIQICLTATTLSIKEIKSMTRMERSNISNYMNELAGKDFFTRKEIKGEKKREAVFTMSKILRYKIESESMKEVELLFQKK